MNHFDHVALLKDGVPAPGGEWADFGSGTGAFTLALAELLGPEGTIHSIDKDDRALQEQEHILKARSPTASVRFIPADFTRPLDLPPLDGIVMANALHYQARKEPLVQRLRGYLKPEGRFILVEYNVDRGNLWVPHPISYPTWEALARRCGFANTRFLESRPSRFLREIYSAVSWGE